MSFETIEQSLANGDLIQKAEMVRKRETPRSLVHILAEDMVHVGVDGVVSFTNSRLDRTRNILEIDARYHSSIREECKEDLGMFFLGTSILGLEQAIVEGYFSLSSHLDFVNEKIRSLPFSYSVKAEELPFFDAKIDPATRKQMAQLADTDPTFASFFTSVNAARFLPNGLKAFLAGTDGFEPVLAIISQYKEAASAVIKPHVPTEKELEQRKLFLTYFDDFIADL